MSKKQKEANRKRAEAMRKSWEKRRAKPVEEKAKPVEKSEFSDLQMVEALLYTQDILQRSMIPFVATHETAKAIREGDRSLEPPMASGTISLAVLIGNLTRECLSTFDTFLPMARRTKKEITFTHTNGVPVSIQIVKEKTRYFKNPDIKFFGVSDFMLPNPFEEYWEERNQIK